MLKVLLLVVALIVPALSMPAAPLQAAGKRLSIAMVLWRGPTEADRGFTDRLEELGYEATYTTLDAKQDRTRLGTLLRNELGPNLDKFDYVYSYETTASMVTKTFLDNRVPQVFSNVAGPVTSEVVRSLAANSGQVDAVYLPLDSSLLTNAKEIGTALQSAGVKSIGALKVYMANGALLGAVPDYYKPGRRLRG